MIYSRTALRVKAMQYLFAFYTQQKTLPDQEAVPFLMYKQLKTSLANDISCLQKAYSAQLQLLLAWAEMDKQEIAKLLIKPKHTLAEVDFFTWIAKNKAFVRLRRNHPAPYSYIEMKTWYRDIIQDHPLVIAYRQEKAAVPWLRKLFQKVFFQHKVFQRYFGELDICWEEHRLILRRWLFKLLENFCEKPEHSFELYDNSTEEKEEMYYTELINHILKTWDHYDNAIAQRISKWTLTRITLLDKLLIKMGLVETLILKSVPHSVAINEYIELAKRYSTPESYIFIHGTMNNLITQEKDDIV